MNSTPPISAAEVLRIAKLARIALEDEELPGIQKKFLAILESFTFLSEANTDGVEAAFHAAEDQAFKDQASESQQMPALRPDHPENPLLREELLANAPEAFENCFKIPRVLSATE